MIPTFANPSLELKGVFPEHDIHFMTWIKHSYSIQTSRKYSSLFSTNPIVNLIQFFYCLFICLIYVYIFFHVCLLCILTFFQNLSVLLAPVVTSNTLVIKAILSTVKKL